MVHYGTTLIAGWPFRRQSLTTPLLLGATWPDVSWIVLHGLRLVLPYEWCVPLQFYAIAYHTPLMSLWAGLIFACVVDRPLPKVLAFVGAAWLHLLLDASLTRYGNGVALIYPVSCQLYNFELFRSEDPVGLALLAVSVGLMFNAGWRGIELLSLRQPSWLLVAVLVSGFILTPMSTWRAAYEANMLNMAFVYSPSVFEGREVGFERNTLVSLSPPQLRTWYGRNLVLSRVPPQTKVGDRISVRGIYHQGKLEVKEIYLHWPHLHDTVSIIALVMLALMFWRAHENKRRMAQPS